MKNCYFCNISCEDFDVYPHKRIYCKSCGYFNFQYFDASGINRILFFKKQFTITIDFKNNYTIITKINEGLFQRIFHINSILNITPQNIESKLKTILTFY